LSTFSLFRAQELRSALALGLASTKMSGTAADARESVHSGNARPQTRGSASERQLTSSTRLRFFSSSSLLRRSSRSTCDSEVRRANAGKEHHRVTVTRGSATFSMLSLFQTFHDLCCKMLSLPNDMAARCWVNLPGPQAARSWSGHGPKARNSWALSSYACGQGEEGHLELGAVLHHQQPARAGGPPPSCPASTSNISLFAVSHAQLAVAVVAAGPRVPRRRYRHCVPAAIPQTLPAAPASAAAEDARCRGPAGLQGRSRRCRPPRPPPPPPGGGRRLRQG